MPRYRPKNPTRSNRQSHKPKAQKIDRLADWLPASDADYAAWRRAAERARAEFAEASKDFWLHQDNPEFRRRYNLAHDTLGYAIERSYPPGFWEGMSDFLAGKSEDLEAYIAFLEEDPYFFRSGYIKQEAIRGLKRTPLTESQRGRLQQAVLNVVEKGFRREFRDFCQLARRIQTEEWLAEVEAKTSSKDKGVAVRARWVLEACRKR